MTTGWTLCFMASAFHNGRARSVMIRSAGPVRACRYPVPAQRCTFSGSPARAAASRRGRVKWCTAGYPKGAVASCLSVNSFRRALAGRRAGEGCRHHRLRSPPGRQGHLCGRGSHHSRRDRKSTVPTMTAAAPARRTSGSCSRVCDSTRGDQWQRTDPTDRDQKIGGRRRADRWVGSWTALCPPASVP